MSFNMWDTKEGRNTSLALNPATRGHAGFYVCNTKNVFGHDVTMVQLIVLRKGSEKTFSDQEMTHEVKKKKRENLDSA